MVCKAVSDSKKFRFVECGADNLHAYGHIVRHTHGNCKTGKSRKVQRKGENIHLVHLQRVGHASFFPCRNRGHGG